MYFSGKGVKSIPKSKRYEEQKNSVNENPLTVRGTGIYGTDTLSARSNDDTGRSSHTMLSAAAAKELKNSDRSVRVSHYCSTGYFSAMCHIYMVDTLLLFCKGLTGITSIAGTKPGFKGTGIVGIKV